MTSQRTLGQARSFPRLQTPTQPSSKRHSPDEIPYTLPSPSSPLSSHRHRRRKSFDVGPGSSVSSLPAYADIFTSSPIPALTKSFTTNVLGKQSSTPLEPRVESQPEWKRASISNRSIKGRADTLEKDKEILSFDQSVPSCMTGDTKVPSLKSGISREKLFRSSDPSDPSICQTPQSNSVLQIREYSSSSLSLSTSSVSLSSSLTERSEHEEQLGFTRLDEETYPYEDFSIWLDRMLTKSTSALATAQVLLSGALGVRGALYDWNEREAEGDGALGRIWVETQCRSKRDDDHNATLTSLTAETLCILGGRPSNQPSSTTFLSSGLKSASEHGRKSIEISDISRVESDQNESLSPQATMARSAKQKDPIGLSSVGRINSSPTVGMSSSFQSSNLPVSSPSLSPSSMTSTTTAKGWSPSTTTNRAPSFIRVRSSPVVDVSDASPTQYSKRVQLSANGSSPLTNGPVPARVRLTKGTDEVCLEEKDDHLKVRSWGEDGTQDIASTKDTPGRVQSRETSPDFKLNGPTSMMSVRSNQMKYSLSFPPEQQPSPSSSSIVFSTTHSNSPSEAQRSGVSTSRHLPVESNDTVGISLSLRAVQPGNRENIQGESSEALIRLRNLGAGTGGDVGEGAGAGRKSWVGGWFGSS
ncbi:hypothetical protein [Phaffia rhodozyma]|uniref:Uncharacterized protein n=1 Tax=Phaffia rhodozyma TaxID=264483 RepID=A0A0F7SMV4_PHARH|nr:hypothetical protein [Phaffia rhodozyma]